jgi:hypothetical protein
MTRARTPRDDLWDTLAEHFGEPRTKTERSQFGKVLSELLEAGATQEEVATACVYVLRTFDSPSVFAVVKWFTVALMDKPKLSSQQAAIEQLRRIP